MSITQYLTRNVATIKKDSSVDEAINVMMSYDVDDVVVVEVKLGKSYPVGLLTSHDIVRSTFRNKTQHREMIVRDIMDRAITTCSESDGFRETISLMQRREVKRLPVVDLEGALVGIVSEADLSNSLGSFDYPATREW